MPAPAPFSLQQQVCFRACSAVPPGVAVAVFNNTVMWIGEAQRLPEAPHREWPSGTTVNLQPRAFETLMAHWDDLAAHGRMAASTPIFEPVGPDEPTDGLVRQFIRTVRAMYPREATSKALIDLCLVVFRKHLAGMSEADRAPYIDSVLQDLDRSENKTGG